LVYNIYLEPHTCGEYVEKGERMKSFGNIVLALMVVIGLFGSLGFFDTAMAAEATCPEGNGWVKIDSDNLSSYPVPGAVDYCFKAGSDNSQGCIGGIFGSWPPPEDGNKYCGLSHWSYKIDDPTNTPVPPSPTWTVTATATDEVTLTPTSTATNTPTIVVTNTNTPTPTATIVGPSATPTATATATNTPNGEITVTVEVPTNTPTVTATIIVATFTPPAEQSPTATATATVVGTVVSTPVPPAEQQTAGGLVFSIWNLLALLGLSGLGAINWPRRK
jgi:hypothetical protein